MTFGKIKQKSLPEAPEPALGSEKSHETVSPVLSSPTASGSTAASMTAAPSPKILTPFQRRSDEEENSGDDAGENRKSRPKVNRMPKALLDNHRVELKTLEGPKAIEDSESMLPPLELKKSRTWDRRFTVGFIALVIVINAVIAMTLGTNGKKNENDAPEAPAVTHSAAPAHTPQQAQMPPSESLPPMLPQAQTSHVVPPVATTQQEQVLSAEPVVPPPSSVPMQAAPAPTTAQPAQPDLMSIINRY